MPFSKREMVDSLILSQAKSLRRKFFEIRISLKLLQNFPYYSSSISAKNKTCFFIYDMIISKIKKKGQSYHEKKCYCQQFLYLAQCQH